MGDLINRDENKLMKSVDVFIGVVSVIGAAAHFFFAYNSSISVSQQRVFHTFFFILVFFMYELKAGVEKKKLYSAIINALMVAFVIAAGTYFIINMSSSSMVTRAISGASKFEIVLGVILILLVMEIARRKVGAALTVLSAIFILYALFGRSMPAIIKHKGYSISYLTEYLTWTTEGIFGTCIGASVTFVCLYIIFGEMLDAFGAGQFFIDIAYAATGRMKGGPAEASVVSSALMGSINGSAVANVVTTGTFTIPLMKKVGYKPEYAGAVEAVASTGGQILPPVMGAAAFVMSDLTGIAYSQIVIAALIPGLLYYIALGISVYLEADKLGLEGEDKSKLKAVKDVLKDGWYYAIPILVLLVCLLAFGFSANYSAVFAIITLAIVGIAKTYFKEKRFPWQEFYQTFRKSMKTTVAVSIACAAAGIVIGIVSMTGIGVKFTRIVFRLAGGNTFMMLLLIMVACIIMGMGLPSTAAYIIAATIGVPPLVQAGFTELGANMFVFYFAIISFITPPVALAAYAGAGIAGSKPGSTGVRAFLLGLSGFIIPFVYVYNPALLIVGSRFSSVVYIAVLALFAVFLLSSSITGWLHGRINIVFRILMCASAVLMFVQGAFWTDILGFVLGVVSVAAVIILNRRASNRAAA